MQVAFSQMSEAFARGFMLFSPDLSRSSPMRDKLNTYSNPVLMIHRHTTGNENFNTVREN